MSDSVRNITDTSFEADVLESSLPVLVDFWATWCGPCKMMAPLLSEAADHYAGKLKICKLEVEENPMTSNRYNVRGIPTMLIFKNGEIEATKVGSLSKTQLIDFIESAV